MPDRPIIFSAPMVRALLDGRKTQTRRMTTQPRFDAQGCHLAGVGPQWWDYWSSDRAEVHRFKVPYAPGDRLYVREAVCWVSGWGWRYRADNDDLAEKREAGEVSRWRPSIHMPRWASRITLTVTAVRVQRLQEISEADAMAEGVEAGETSRGLMWKAYGDDQNCWVDTARISYIHLWNSLHGPDAWDANPWVVAVSFTVRKGNIDQETTP